MVATEARCWCGEPVEREGYECAKCVQWVLRTLAKDVRTKRSIIAAMPATVPEQAAVTKKG